MVLVNTADLDLGIVSPARARAAIAAAIATTEDNEDHPDLGAVTLHPHQLDAVRRVRSAIAEFGGALLCDPAGMGKTFVALAMIPELSDACVVAPAVLRNMWLEEAQRCRRSIQFISFETLSRTNVESNARLLVVDEAHHARNPAARRFGSLSRLAQAKQVLLLTATPIHNKRKDLTSVLSLFLGSRAERLSDAELGRCVLRRDRAGRTSPVFPRVERLRWYTLPENDALLGMILALPPPLPPSDGGDGGVLVAHSLIRQWASSDGALRCGLSRRLQNARALIAALEDGTYPSRSELTAWTGAEDSIQLAFSTLVASSSGDAATLLPLVLAHHDAIAALLREVRSDFTRDRERAAIIRSVREAHAGAKIVVFTQFADTVDTMFAHLVADGRVAALTGFGARVAGGRITRTEAIERFAPRASNRTPAGPAEEINLLITTDLLSEGVNLQDASVVIHLDLPWTPARMEQRLGRVARQGSLQEAVFSYAIRPPASTREIVRMERILRDKMSEAGIVTADFPSLLDAGCKMPPTDNGQPAIVESIRRTIREWHPEDVADSNGKGVVSVVDGSVDGFLAACRKDGQVRLIASRRRTISEDPESVLEGVRSCAGRTAAVEVDELAGVVTSLRSYIEAECALGGARPGPACGTAKAAALRHISRISRQARRHERAEIASIAVRARLALDANLGAESERQLSELSKAAMNDRAWLAGVIELGMRHCRRSPGPDSQDGLIALIIFRRKDDANALSRATER